MNKRKGALPALASGKWLTKPALVVALGIALSSVTGFAFAHSGGTDRTGCHLNHKTGVYHCH